MIKYDDISIVNTATNNISGRDFSWKILINDISIIGGGRLRLGDDDASVIVFITNNKDVFPITINQSIENRKLITEFLHDNFDVNYDLIETDDKNYDNLLIYYPQEFKGVKIFKFDFLHFVKKGLNIVHFASGVLSGDVDKIISEEQR